MSQLLPRFKPMLLESAREVPVGDQWAFEVKADGWRVLVYVDHVVRVATRSGRDVSAQLPELAELRAVLKRHRAVLDAELVAPNPDGLPSFARLQGRMLAGTSAPVALHIFDLLYLDGHDLTRLPYRERRQRLGELDLKGSAWRTTTYATTDGAALLAASRELGLEGIVAKRLGSLYRPGQRSRDWLKIKNFTTEELVVGGVVLDRGLLAWILVGQMVDDRLVYVGQVSAEFGGRYVGALAGLLDDLRADVSPFGAGAPVRRPVVHLQARLGIRVKYLERGEGRFRHSTIEGLRTLP